MNGTLLLVYKMECQCSDCGIDFYAFFRLAATRRINDTGSHGDAVQRARDYSDWCLCRLRNLRCAKGKFIFVVISVTVCNEHDESV